MERIRKLHANKKDKMLHNDWSHLKKIMHSCCLSLCDFQKFFPAEPYSVNAYLLEFMSLGGARSNSYTGHMVILFLSQPYLK